MGTARAAGFAAAPTADPALWLATTGADCVVPARWLADQVAHHGGSAEGVIGTVAVDRQEHVATTRQLHRAGGATHDHVDGANLGVRADAYWRVGGFRPLRVGADVDLVERLAAARTPIVRDTRDPVLTSARVS